MKQAGWQAPEAVCLLWRSKKQRWGDWVPGSRGTMLNQCHPPAKLSQSLLSGQGEKHSFTPTCIPSRRKEEWGANLRAKVPNNVGPGVLLIFNRGTTWWLVAEHKGQGWSAHYLCWEEMISFVGSGHHINNNDYPYCCCQLVFTTQLHSLSTT